MTSSRQLSNRTIRFLVIGGVFAAAAGIAGSRVHNTGALVLLRSLVFREASSPTQAAASAAEARTVAAVEHAFPGWSVAIFGQPTIRPERDGVVLDGDSAKPSGLFFKRKLNTEHVYRLKVQGAAQGILPALRLRLDNHPLTWHALPDGDTDMILPRSAEIEALIYADVAYSFNLRAIGVEPCPDCITDEILKKQVIAEAHVSPDDGPLVLARKLRNWTADAVVLGGESANMEATTKAVVRLSASQTYSEIFKPGLGGVSCAGFAAFYQKVLEIFGLTSFTIDIGYDNKSSLTHVTTILVLGPSDDRQYYIFDPTFSGAYVKDGKAVDVLRLLKGEKAEFRTAPMSRRVLIPHAQLERFLSDNAAAHSQAVCDRESPIPNTTECHGFVDSAAYNRIMMARVMAENGFSRDQDFILGLMQHGVIGVLASPLDPQAHVPFLQQLAELGIAIPKL